MSKDPVMRAIIWKIGAKVVRHGRYITSQIAGVAVSRNYLLKSCFGSIACDVVRPENVAPWYELGENGLFFPAQAQKIIATLIENG